MSVGLNRASSLYYSNPNRFKQIMRSEKILRRVDDVYLIDSLGNLISTSIEDDKNYIPPDNQALEMVFAEERSLKIINTYENKSAAILKLNNFIDTYLYVIKYLDEEISNYLTESETAINFYYTVENKRTGIKITFIFIYIVVVTLLLFLSISISIKFSSRFFRSISNLISASSNIGLGNLNTKVPEIETEKELEKLNKNFNFMIEKLKNQQEKLLINERHEAWENVARKLAHEIKNPLTPIQLTIDRLKDKYLKLINSPDKENFSENLKIILKQIKQIENLVNEFSDFARMPKPIFKKNNITKIVEDNIKLLKEIDRSIDINFVKPLKEIIFYCDNEQINRVILNLIKNSIESIQEKSSKGTDFIKKIDIEITNKNDYIRLTITDNGIGFSNTNLDNILKPYFTTKIKGSGLGLSIVNKIINDHNGNIKFIPKDTGAKIVINFSKNVDRNINH